MFGKQWSCHFDESVQCGKKVVKIGNLGEGKVERKLSSVSPSDGECSLHGQLTTLFEIDR